MKGMFIGAVLLFAVLLYGLQEEPPDTTSLWKHSLISALTFTQVSYTNWVQGGQRSLAYAVAVDGKSKWEGETMKWSSTYKLSFGQARLSGHNPY